MVLYTTPVACYVPVFPPSFPPPIDQPTVTSLVKVIGHDVAPAGYTLVIDSVQKTVEEISLVFTTGGDNTDLFETNMAQEQSALARTRILILQMNNQHLIQAHRQVSDLFFHCSPPVLISSSSLCYTIQAILSS